MTYVQDFITTFLDPTDEDVESIEYHNAAGAAARTIRARVRRQVSAPVAGERRVIAPECLVEVANDATYGISSAELDLGGDQVKIALRLGKTPELRTIANLVYHDAGMLRLEVR